MDPSISPTSFLWSQYIPSRYYYEVPYSVLGALLCLVRTTFKLARLSEVPKHLFIDHLEGSLALDIVHGPHWWHMS